MNRIPQLPPWNLTNPLPAFHDYESLSAIDQTARLYGTMRGLIDDYNEFANQVNAKILEFVYDLNADQEQFENDINKLVHDYIIALDMKVAHQDRQIEETVTYFKTNLKQAITDLTNEMKDSGELENTILNAFNDLGGRVLTLENSFDRMRNNYINVKGYGVKGDGITDDTQAIQTLINNNPHNTLFFPAGKYLINQPLILKQSNDCFVNLYFDENAILFTNTEIESLIEIGFDESKGPYTRYNQPYKNIVIKGGIFDCTNTIQGIKHNSKCQLTQIIDCKFINFKTYGIYLYRDSEVMSGDCLLKNLYFMGIKSNTTEICTGIRVDSHDNKLEHIRISRCKTGIELNGATNYLFNIHAVFMFVTEIPDNYTVEEFNSTTGFLINGSMNLLLQCYADTFGVGFKITTDDPVILDSCNTYYYCAKDETEYYCVKFTTNHPKAKISNCIFDLINKGKSHIIYIEDQSVTKNIAINNNLELINNRYSTNSNIPITDSSYNQQLNKNTGFSPFWYGSELETDKYFPIAVIAESDNVYDINVDIDINSKINLLFSYNWLGNAQFLKQETIYNNGKHYKFALLNPFVDDKNMKYCYLCVKATNGEKLPSAIAVSNLIKNGNNGVFFKETTFASEMNVVSEIASVEIS